MNILFVSKEGDSLSIATRVLKEGHRVQFYVEEKNAKQIGDGMVEKVGQKGRLSTEGGQVIRDSVLSLLESTKPELAVFDMVGMGRVADFIRGKGVPVLGGSAWADHAELNREYGTKIMKLAGINLPLSTFWKRDEYEKAAEHVRKTGRRYVYKPFSNIATSHTYVAKAVDDMVEMLGRWKGEEDFQLQEFVDGVEVSSEVWWNGLRPLFYSWTMEDKKFMVDGVGPNVGSAGSVVSMIGEKSRLVREGIGKVERLLKQTSYRGPIDLNAIVTQDKLFGLEFTIRFGYDAIQPLFELYRGSPLQLLHHTATGAVPGLNFFSGYGISVRLSVPPYPHHTPGRADIPIMNMNNDSAKHIWLSDVRSGEKDYETAGYDGIVAAVTARGSSVREARRRVYRTISNLTIPQVQYRTDIGDRVRNRDVVDEWDRKMVHITGDEAKLKRWGWL